MLPVGSGASSWYCLDVYREGGELHPVNEVNTKGQFFRASFGKKTQVPKTARQAASLPGDISRGKRRYYQANCHV